MRLQYVNINLAKMSGECLEPKLRLGLCPGRFSFYSLHLGQNIVFCGIATSHLHVLEICR